VLRLSRRLDPTHRVLRYDRRGYGRSVGVGPPWTVEANIDDLEGLLAREPTRPAVLFGHSFGGNVALGLAARRPELVRGVVVYETPLSWLDWWPGDSAGAAAMAQHDPGDAAEAFMRRLVGDEVWERLPEARRADRRAEGAAMVAELADLRRAAPWDGDQIVAPVFALRGEHARPHHHAAGDAMRNLIPRCRTAVVTGAGHAGPHTHAAEVASAMVPFLASLSPGPAAAAG
jgi:pimeloyl-ACP methyl ester carboxylesterase